MKRLSAIRAIRKFCLDCCGSYKEVELCTANPAEIKKAKKLGEEEGYEGCPLYEYRFGHNPARKGLGNKSPNFKKKPQLSDALSGEPDLGGSPRTRGAQEKPEIGAELPTQDAVGEKAKPV